MQDMGNDSVQPTGPGLYESLLSPCSPASPIVGKVCVTVSIIPVVSQYSTKGRQVHFIACTSS